MHAKNSWRKKNLYLYKCYFSMIITHKILSTINHRLEHKKRNNLADLPWWFIPHSQWTWIRDISLNFYRSDIPIRTSFVNYITLLRHEWSLVIPKVRRSRQLVIRKTIEKLERTRENVEMKLSSNNITRNNS